MSKRIYRAKRKKDLKREYKALRRYIFKNKKKSMWFLAISIVMISILFISLFCVFGNYDGLGIPKEISFNDYKASGFYSENGIIKYDDENYTWKFGIDVSEYQGKIDWKKVSQSNVSFAFIRVGGRGYGNGQIYEDKYFEYNIEEAKKYGIKVGVYFFSQAISVDEAVEEAEFVVRKIRFKGIDYPVVFDMEPVFNNTGVISDRISKLTPKMRSEITDAFCTIVEKNSYDTMVYGNPQWFFNYVDMRYLEDYPKWLAHYANLPDFKYRYRFWQYSSQGRISGINRNVDLNLELVPKK